MNIVYPLTTLSFAYPQAFAFPIVMFFFALTREKSEQAVPVPDAGALAAIPRSLRQRLRKPVLALLSGAFILLLSIAAARPQRVSTIASPYRARNLMLTLDLSRSMATEDFASRRGAVSRLSGVKTVVKEFVEARKQDRIGLVVFGSNAYLQSPLTLDHAVVSELVDRLEVGIAGDATAIGDGLGLSLKRIQDIEGTSKAIILLTDGVSNAGQVNPIKAAKVAKELGVKVHTIGIGSTDTLRVAQRGFFSQQMVAQAEFDEATLKEIADITGGVYFNADSIDGLKKVYAEIDRLETSTQDEPERQVADEYFVPYAIAALVTYLAYLLCARTVFLKVP